MDERKSKIFKKLIDNQKSYATLVGSAGRAWLSGPDPSKSFEPWGLGSAGRAWLSGPDPSKSFEPWGLGSAGCLEFGWAQTGITDW